MTVVSSIIKDALRETNIIPIGKTPTDAEYAEGLSRLQTLIDSVKGNEAGENLTPYAIGRNEINSPSAYPWYNDSLPSDVYLPLNVRLMLNLNSVGQANLHPRPYDGSRIAVVDVSQNLGSYGFTLVGNGRSIEGDDAVTLEDGGMSREWMYRADTGNWVRVTDITLTSDMPYPREFDDMFIILLATRLNPRYGQSLDPASQMMLSRARSQFRARYRQVIQVDSEEGLLRLTNNNNRFYRSLDSSVESFNYGNSS